MTFLKEERRKIGLGVSSMGVFNISDISEDGEQLLCFGAEHGEGFKRVVSSGY